ncbi:MAG: glycosyltransferase family 2 protein [Candidatus Binatia bacterium]
MSHQPAVSILIVNYNTAALTKNCIASLHAQTVRNHVSGADGVEMIVIDNASRPDERRDLDGLDATLILNDKNRGYGAALNQALTRATGEFILFSNSDTWYFPGALQQLLDNFQRLPRCGAVGPRLWWDHERDFLLPPSDLVTPLSFVLDTVVRYRRTLTDRRVDWWRRRALNYWQALTPLEQPLLSGACLLTHKAVLSACGGFDERFSLYYEDTDWCRRVRRQGYRLYYVPAAEVAHLYNQSARQVIDAAQRAGNASLEYYFCKHYGRWFWRLLVLASMNKGIARRRARMSVGYHDLGVLKEPPTFSLLEDEGPYLLQLSPQADCLPAIGRFCSTPHFSFSQSVWAQLMEGEFFAQVFLLPRLQLREKWRWWKVNGSAI